MKEKFNFMDFRMNATAWYMQHKPLVFLNIFGLGICLFFLTRPLFILLILGIMICLMFWSGWYKEVIEPSFREVED